MSQPDNQVGSPEGAGPASFKPYVPASQSPPEFTVSSVLLGIFFGVFLRLTGETERRKATTALRSPSAMPLKDVKG